MNERIEVYADKLEKFRAADHVDVAALGLIQSALICASDDADAVARIRDVLAAVDLLRDRTVADLQATIAAARLGGAQ